MSTSTKKNADRAYEDVLDDTMTSPILGLYELTVCTSQLSAIVATTSTDTIFGEKIVHVDPMAEAMRLILERKAPFVVMREMLDGKEVGESIDIRKMTFDEVGLKDELMCRLNHASISATIDWDTISSTIDSSTGEVSTIGSFTIPRQ